MFKIPWEGKLTSLKASGDAGENKIQATFVTGAEDGLFGRDTVGPIARRIFKYVKAGKIGSVPLKMKERYLCQMIISYMDSTGKTQRHEFNRAIPETCMIVSVKDQDQPPKVRMVVSVEYTEKELVFLAHAFRRDLTVEIGSQQEVFPFDQTDETADAVAQPKKREKTATGNGHADAPVAP